MTVQSRRSFLPLIILLCHLSFMPGDVFSKPAQDPILKTGYELYQSGEQEKAFDLAILTINTNPKDLSGYQLFVELARLEHRHNQIVAVVREAEKQGLEDSNLFKYQARALFELQQLGASFSALRKMENAHYKRRSQP